MDEITPAEAADQARRIIGQIEGLQWWANTNLAGGGRDHLQHALIDAATYMARAERLLQEADRRYYTGRVQYDRSPVRPLGEQ